MRVTTAMAAIIVTLPMIATAQSIQFGDNASEWANDGECDDRRFRGALMAGGLDRDDVGHDAADCKRGFDLGELTLWDFNAAKAVTQCAAINFGDDSGEYTNDGLCDDYRFDGPGADYVLLKEDIGRDASDCKRLCNAGQIALRGD